MDQPSSTNFQTEGSFEDLNSLNRTDGDIDAMILRPMLPKKKVRKSRQ